jgi:hypothetical protein
MGWHTALLYASLAAADPPAPPSATDDSAPERAEEPPGGAGVSPIELIPRVELRQSFQRLHNGVSISDTTTEIHIQFVKRLLLRYQVPFRVMGTPAGQVSGISDAQVQALAVLISNERALVAVLAGAVLDTATQPQLGAGKQQVFFGGGAAYKPRRWWIAYGVVQEQISIDGCAARSDVNELTGVLGSILFGGQYNWLKVDLGTTFDFPASEGRLFGTFEVGSLLIGRVGLFARTGTQLFGSRQLDYSLTGGVRYLFRLGPKSSAGPRDRSYRGS